MVVNNLKIWSPARDAINTERQHHVTRAPRVQEKSGCIYICTAYSRPMILTYIYLSENERQRPLVTRNRAVFVNDKFTIKVVRRNRLVTLTLAQRRILAHLERFPANGTLIVPRWRSAYFWPLLCTEDGSFKPFIKDYVIYSKPVNFFGFSKLTVFNNTPSDMMVLKIRF